MDRRIEVTREGGRRRLRRLIAALSMASAVGLAAAVAYSPLLGVRHVRIAGAQRTTEADVRSAVHLGAGRPMVDVDGPALAGRLRALPWVATARVTRRWPATVRIDLTERRPVATLATTAPCGAPDCAALVDATGRVLALVTAAEARAEGVVAVTSVPPAGAPGSRTDAAAAGALTVAAALPVSLHRRVTAVAAGPDGEVTLHLTAMVTQPAPVVLLGPPDRVADKLTAAATVLTAVKQDGLVTIDVRVPEAPALTRSGGTR
jgi:cell division protein FtsQ